MPPNNWDEFYKLTKDKPPSPLLVKAVTHVLHKEAALDMGAGALKDTKYLLAEGFEQITVLDKEPLTNTDIKELPNDRINFIISSFEDFIFPVSAYNIVNAQYALPFCSPASFNAMFENLKKSLKPQGIFTGQFFGTNDEWCGQKPDITFHNEQEVRALLSDMEIIELEEYDKDSKLANGSPKHWHYFNIIAKKI